MDLKKICSGVVINPEFAMPQWVGIKNRPLTTVYDPTTKLKSLQNVDAHSILIPPMYSGTSFWGAFSILSNNVLILRHWPVSKLEPKSEIQAEI